MKSYVEALIVEQINRISTLKEFIKLPLKSPYLESLSERCNDILKRQLIVLNNLQAKLSEENTDLRWIHRQVGMVIKKVSLVESYGISSLRFPIPEVDFLNALAFKITSEISLPLNPPSVSCLSTDYFYFEPITRMIYVPQAESEFLLHIPDLYHEIGHYVLFSSEESGAPEKLVTVANAVNSIFSDITTYFKNLMDQTTMNPSPNEIPLILGRIHSSWKAWLNEFLCDLFAVFTLGPAFVWSHLHLVVKTSDNVYQGSWLSSDDHPADEARMRLMLIGLRLIGFDREAEEIKGKWTRLTGNLDSPDAYYRFAYPDSILQNLADKYLAALRSAGFSIISSTDLLADSASQHVCNVLNRAWAKFWGSKPEQYRQWEKSEISSLKKNLQLPQDHSDKSTKKLICKNGNMLSLNYLLSHTYTLTHSAR
jgi:hypothetical protein